MDLFLSIFPIVLLIYLMVKRNAFPSYVALPLIGGLVYVLQLFYFKNEFVLLNANIVSAIISVFTPISVIFGAVFFNHMMETSGAMNTLRQWLGNINPNPVAQLMIIGWAFAFMLEGASGFGTPVAIAAPILVGLGFKPMPVVMLALVMNSVPVSFGAVGTPTWYGFKTLLDSGTINGDDVSKIGQITALIHLIAGFVIPVLALRFIVSWKEIKQNALFILISILSCTLPYFLIAQFNYEFPSLVGGAIGLFISVWVAGKGIGLSKVEAQEEKQPIAATTLVKAFTPTLLLIVILVLTRIKQLPFKAMLNNATDWLHFPLGEMGDLKVTKGLIFSVENIFRTGVSDSYKLLYTPSLIPFIVTVLISFFLFRLPKDKCKGIYLKSALQMQKPFLALVGAMIMVKLMMVGGEDSMTQVIGKGLANATQQYWVSFASYLGALGAFFSGSNTISNVTFGAVQYSVATATGLSVPLILALQSVGGAMGNMVCINNIIAGCSVLGIDKAEGSILKKTAIPMLVYGIIAAIVALFL
ncbi:MAG: L-lactate permease [Capnocytophaga sp.]|uniref:L-lactate permease n=1 Tax=Capnocytophaga sp. oral taxon 863 TaxID=1227265 RepID=UPI000396B9DC|nr:L-lactate permease [Capnocytophaga sp. oral taxon 863]ERI63403.1 transporter, lactate permease family [Capnocytophaga sp. oral taxon 863 str. F0517]RKW10464.1 MAG: L-lactate permease [Capnocytophaga sp.]